MKSKLPVIVEPGGGCSRRTAVQGLCAAALGAVVLPGCVGGSGSSVPPASTTMCGTDVCIDLADPDNAALAAVNGALLVDLGSDTVMVIRTSQTAVAAASAICTHNGCTVDFDAGNQVLSCPCHGSVFGEDGSVIRGPARRPLQTYTATLANNVITITP